ncbi:putative laccase-9 [Eucalyptus grandis]|uniref:putative laccase-9 n=1 Tax=Eucalyptus grandis TaxID=71139 RepID=UPI00192EE2AF|nr:putative laccase-9 [Eucalyptus grandis]
MSMATSSSNSSNIFLAAVLLVFGNVVLGAQASNVHYYDFVLREINVTRNCTTTTILVVNDSLPGPTIRARKGDLVYVKVHNQGLYGVTLHWHGVKQPRNPWSDGPEYITQCAIPPGTNFTYEVNLTDEEGTVWWHAHSEWTRSTVHGAIVVLPREGSNFPFAKPEGEHLIVLGSWYNEGTSLNKALEMELSIGSPNVPRATGYLINGQFGDFVPCSNDTTPHFFVDYGKTYLFRIVNAVVGSEMFVSIADHNMMLVGMDGAYTKPIVVSYLMIEPGQTMDVLVTANQSPGRYYMAAQRFSSEDMDFTKFAHVVATTIIQYEGNFSLTSPPSYPNDTLPFYHDYSAAASFTQQLRGLASEEHPVDVPHNVTTRMFITASMNDVACPNDSCYFGDTKIATTLNNISWEDPSVDVLQAYYRNISGVYTTDFPDLPPVLYNFTGDDLSTSLAEAAAGTSVKVLNYNETVEIVFQGTNLLEGSENHPMHMHGYSFYVVGVGLGNFNNETDPEKYNLVDPPKVNTFGVPKRGWVAIRFRASNPGVWYWHCHIDRHMSWGMNTAFIVKNGDTEETSMRPPPSYMPPCIASKDKSYGEISQTLKSDM